jgi:hypothetical protein
LKLPTVRFTHSYTQRQPSCYIPTGNYPLRKILLSQSLNEQPARWTNLPRLVNLSLYGHYSSRHLKLFCIEFQDETDLTIVTIALSHSLSSNHPRTVSTTLMEKMRFFCARFVTEAKWLVRGGNLRQEGASLGRHSLICCDRAVLNTRYNGNY